MRKINTAAEVLEVMGAPLSGSDLRAYVMSGGGMTFKKFKPTIRSKRCFLLFPVQGSERKGLVSVEVKKKKGQVSLSQLHTCPFTQPSSVFVQAIIFKFVISADKVQYLNS